MEEMNMVINRLPVMTWNHLHMNDSVVKGVQIEKEGTLEISGPELKRDDELVRQFDEISSGAGEDLDKLAASAGIPVRSFAVDKRLLSGDEANAPLKLKFKFADGGKSMNRIGLSVRDNEQLDVIMEYKSEGNANGTAAVQTKLRVGIGGKLRLIQLFHMGDDFTFINDIGAECAEDASFELIQIVATGHKTYLGLETVLIGDRSSFKCDLGYSVKGEDMLDINDVVRHVGKHTESEINAGGALSDRARKLFRGTIDFIEGASGSVGSESEDVLLTDETVVNQTIPLILCAEEDVVGNHGASIGKPDEEVLFYLNSRGIGGDEAIEMLKRAKLDRVCGKIWDVQTRCEENRRLHIG